MKGQQQVARSVTRVYVEESGMTSEFIEIERTLHICFNLEGGGTISVWFDPHGKGIRISGKEGYLLVKPRADNVVTVKVVSDWAGDE